MIDGYLNKA